VIYQILVVSCQKSISTRYTTNYHTMKNDTLENRLNLARIKAKIPDDKLLMGSLKGKFPVLMKDGKTVIYIADLSKAEEIKERYELQRNSRYPNSSGNNNG